MTLGKLIAHAPAARPASSAEQFVPKSIADTVERYFEDPITGPFDRPNHLQPLVDEFDAAVFGPGSRETAAHAPPRHGKTECALAAILTMAIVKPGMKHAYATFNQERADSVKAKFEQLALRAGLKPSGSSDCLYLAGGTEVRFVGVGGTITGEGVSGLLIVDDYAKSSREAYSPPVRASTEHWYTTTARTRVEPGASIFVIATRWHPSDLSSYVCKDQPAAEGCPARKGFKWLRLAAICDDADADPCGREVNAPLWPERRPLEYLQRFFHPRKTWLSLYQGLAVDDQNDLFGGDPAYYTGPAPAGKSGVGIDCAYAGKSRSDHSCAIKGTVALVGGQKLLYITNAMRVQEKFETWAPRAAAFAKGLRVRWHIGRGEEGAVKTLRDNGMRLEPKPAQGQDKLARARNSGAVAAWGEGRILLPEPGPAAPWVAPLVEALTQWSGLPGEQDDDVDALSSLCELLKVSNESGGDARAEWTRLRESGARGFSSRWGERRRFEGFGKD